MMDRQHGLILFECDVCGTVLETDERDFDTARGMLRSEGWSARKLGADWVHACSKCGVAGERAPLARNARLL